MRGFLFQLNDILEQFMKKIALFLFLLLLLGTIAGTFFLYQRNSLPLISPEPKPVAELPLLKYRIEELHLNTYQGSQIQVEKLIKKESSYSSYLFSFQTTGKKMSGVINVPDSPENEGKAFPILVMVRGYIPFASYISGDGTKNAAAFFAEHGYVTIAPDFLGFGESDPESKDTWEARFQKPIQVVELLKTVEHQNTLELPNQHILLDTKHVGMWAHSNGGQIALTSLEIIGQPIPTTLWAPVTAPFPYSVLYFSDEEADEGKASRKWINEFDQSYDALEFSLTQHLNLLTGTMQLHQGVADEAIHYVWSDEFVDKVKAENVRRKNIAHQNPQPEATASAKVNVSLDPIELTYFKYPNSNHNMQPDWSTVIQRDLAFFDKELKDR